MCTDLTRFVLINLVKISHRDLLLGTLGTRGFSRVVRALFGRRPKTRAAKPREKPLAQSALIYCAEWTLTSSLICQSNRRFHTVITCTST